MRFASYLLITKIKKAMNGKTMAVTHPVNNTIALGWVRWSVEEEVIFDNVALVQILLTQNKSSFEIDSSGGIQSQYRGFSENSKIVLL